jgi:hypothetical protein
MRKFYIILGIAAIAALAAVYVLILNPALNNDRPAVSGGTVVTDEEEVNSRALAFVQPAYRDDYGNTRVAGYVDNLGDRALNAATLSIELRDAEGNRSALLEHTVTAIPANQRKWFDIDAGTWDGPQRPAVTVTSIEVAR